MVLRAEASFPLAVRLRSGAGAPLGDVMTFMSGLYFRGKQAYARAFGTTGAFVITPNRGLWPLEETITARELCDFARGDIDAANPRYRRPLVADVRRLAAA